MQEIVYSTGDRLMSVAISAAPALQPGRPRELVKFRSPIVDFDMTLDGDRFLVVHADTQNTVARELHVVSNWFEDVKRILPAR